MTILELLESKRVLLVETTANQDGAEFQEMCDWDGGVILNKEEILQLAQELIALAATLK